MRVIVEAMTLGLGVSWSGGERGRGKVHDAEEEGGHDDYLFGTRDLNGPDYLGGDGEDGEFG